MRKSQYAYRGFIPETKDGLEDVRNSANFVHGFPTRVIPTRLKVSNGVPEIAENGYSPGFLLCTIRLSARRRHSPEMKELGESVSQGGGRARRPAARARSLSFLYSGRLHENYQA